MKEKVNQMFKDKLFLVMLVLGLLTIVAAAGAATIQRGSGQEQNPYVDMQGQENFLAEKDSKPSVAGESNAQLPQETKQASAETGNNLDTAVKEQERELAQETAAEQMEGQAQEAGAGQEAAAALMLNFSETDKMAWPIRGNVILDYSMDSTIYFPTLDQYKCSPGLVIQGQAGDPVCAPANARVLNSAANEEIGNYLELDLGNGYRAVCGQLDQMTVVPGEYLEKGQLMGYVAEPTKYYTLEGSNVFFELMHDEQAVDPLDYME